MLDHKWAAWEKKENVMAYEIVCECKNAIGILWITAASAFAI